MTVHERQAIRDAVVTLLTGTAPNFATSAEQRIFKTRLAPVRASELPAISVYCDNETVTDNQSSPRELTRTMTVAIDGWARATENVDDALDDLALEIETAMDSSTELLDTAYSAVLTTTEVGIKLDGDRPMGCVHLEYTVVYHSDLRVGHATDDFDTADIHISDLAHDHVTHIHQP